MKQARSLATLLGRWWRGASFSCEGGGGLFGLVRSQGEVDKISIESVMGWQVEWRVTYGDPGSGGRAKSRWDRAVSVEVQLI